MAYYHGPSGDRLPYPRYKVLSDTGRDRHFKYFKDAELDHFNRKRKGKGCCQVWHEFKTFDVLVIDHDGNNVRKENMREYYP